MTYRYYLVRSHAGKKNTIVRHSVDNLQWQRFNTLDTLSNDEFHKRYKILAELKIDTGTVEQSNG